MGNNASVPEEERVSEERGSRSGDLSSSEGSSSKRAATNVEAASDSSSGSPPKRARGDGSSRELSSEGSSSKRAATSAEATSGSSIGSPPTPEELSIVEEAMKKNWGIDEPHSFQVRAIHEGSFKDGRVIHVWAKTGSGKSAIPLTISSLRRGITIVLVPLLGLGSDQAAKSDGVGTNIESYHVDEYQGEDANMLRARLLSYDEKEADQVSIILFMSPQALGTTSHWFETLKSLAKDDLISLLCIDEAHVIEQQGRHFRPEFQVAVSNMNELFKLLPTKVPRLAMSATIQQVDIDTLNRLWESKPDYTEWTEMSRREIFFAVVVSGNPSVSIHSSLKHDYKSEPPDSKLQAIVYTNSKKKAEESLTPQAEKILDTMGIKGDVMPITGDCGLMQKVFLMAAFCGEAKLEECITEDSLGDETAADRDLARDLSALNLLVLPATSAANCGVSSNHCHRSYRLGFPPCWYDVVQEMGRVARRQGARPGVNRYEVHISFALFVTLYVRIQQVADSAERKKQLVAVFELLKFLVTPDRCQHILLEEKFEDPSFPMERTKCDNCCSYCTGDHDEHTGKVNRQALTNIVLTQVLNAQKQLNYSAFLSLIKERKGAIFHKDHIPKDAGPIHALCLQMLAIGLIQLNVDNSLVGTSKLEAQHVMVNAGTVRMQGYDGLAIIVENNWAGINYY